MMRYTCTLLLLSLSLASWAQDLEPTEELALINVLVTDFANGVKPGEQILFKQESSGKEVSAVTNSDGRTQVLLDEGESYLIKIQGLGGAKDYDKFALPDAPGMIASEIHIQYEWEERVITLENVHFDTGKSTLRPESYPELNDLVEVLQLKPQLVIEIAGHTDNQGSEASNLTLSHNRAKRVRDYLLNKGIAAKRVQARGYGETEPVATNETSDGRQQNRRTEVRVLSE